MEQPNLTVHISNFNDRVRAMNQMRQPEIRLSSIDANNLIADILAVLAQNVQQHTQQQAASSTVVDVVMDGGGFK